MDDDTFIRKSMDTRRAKLLAQQEADEIKIRLCDDIRREKASVAGLVDKVAALEYTEPDLFAYIRWLEFIQCGIWCPKCETVKQIGGRVVGVNTGGVEGPHENTVEDVDEGVLAAELARLEAALAAIKADKQALDRKIAALEKDVKSVFCGRNTLPAVVDPHPEPPTGPHPESPTDLDFGYGPDFSTFSCIPDEVISSDELLSI